MYLIVRHITYRNISSKAQPNIGWKERKSAKCFPHLATTQKDTVGGKNTFLHIFSTSLSNNSNYLKQIDMDLNKTQMGT